ncbi:hypothetical protein K503DRAFT_771234 [Rhizopogon vinicolor AM-OR11-026]|uniref:Uncharacterized protein n=1 Tax=Rhizopogon vinicolor AM-OR11-026 TaxID=1314800 RepID=A0A1B7MYL9_9AGAM|nr:hypothetical protein K503DRAFT_771234 [Rhizopogon vinicolor AM-OR11-026]
MRFSFLVTIVTLTTSMSVSACSNYAYPCLRDSDCCGYPSGILYCDTNSSVCVNG